MTRPRLLVFSAVALAAAGAVYYKAHARPTTIVLTGIVTTNDVIVSPQVGGQISRLLVKEGDAVTAGQRVAVISPDELKADRAYYAHSAEGYSSQVQEAEAALRYEEQQTAHQIDQAQATQAAAEAQQAAAGSDQEIARLTLARDRALVKNGVETQQTLDQAQTTFDAATAKLDVAKKQVDAARAALALAKSNAEQVAVRRRALEAGEHQQAAAQAQAAKADVRLAYTEMRAPVNGVVDVRAAREGEVVAAGQPVLTLINPDDLWIRADVEETYVDSIKLGDRMTVRLPSGKEEPGTVIFRGVDAGFATQRDVSRIKRDIKTFEVRLRVDNRDRHLAVGMTAYVLLPIGGA